jgi:hypothetical protein
MWLSQITRIHREQKKAREAEARENAERLVALRAREGGME